jgi:hypothetical protein
MDIVIQPYKFLVSFAAVVAQLAVLAHLTMTHPARLLKKNHIFGVNQTKSSILAAAFSILLFMSIYSIGAIVISYERGQVVSLAETLSRSDIILKMAEVFIESAQMSLVFYITSFLLPIALTTELAERDVSSIRFLLIYSVSRILFYPLILFCYRKHVPLGMYLIEVLSLAEFVLIAIIYSVLLKRVARLRKLLFNLHLFDRYEIELVLSDTRRMVSGLMVHILLELACRIIYIIILFSPGSLKYSILVDIMLLVRLISFVWVYKCIADVIFHSNTSNDIYLQKMDYIMKYLEHSQDKFMVRDSRVGQTEIPE